MQNCTEKKIYEVPTIEIIDFTLKENIAFDIITSGTGNGDV